MSTIALNNVIINHREDGTVALWHVRGVNGLVFPTKMCAEMYARNMFPTEDASARYNRITVRTYSQGD